MGTMDKKIEKYLTRLNERKYTLEDVGSYISSEGLQYTIQNGITFNNIEDKKLAKMFKQCEDLMNDIEKYLKDYIVEM